MSSTREYASTCSMFSSVGLGFFSRDLFKLFLSISASSRKTLFLAVAIFLRAFMKKSKSWSSRYSSTVASK